MDIRNSLDGLKSLFGVASATPEATRQTRSTQFDTSVLGSDRATLSEAASEASQAAIEGDVRMDKVASMQVVLASGTYSVPAKAVAAKVVDSMLGIMK
jgi:anti-sigma28 factor (negative regulator of flagellin synthesis)